SPQTMAPEQFRNDAVLPATDLYALGCTVFGMLTGRPPFRGNLMKLMKLHCEAPPPLELLDPVAPPALKGWIGSLMRKDPHSRPPSAAAALDTLHRIASHGAHYISPPKEQVHISAPQKATAATVRLPNFRSSFVGRERAHAALDTFVTQGARLITLHGIGGLGKTRLAIEWARSRAGGYPGGVFFVGLDEAHEVDAIILAMAKALDLHQLTDPPLKQIQTRLAKLGRALVILDNFEQIVHLAAQVLDPWLDGAPEVTFVVTSRHSLGLRGEQLVEVEPLSTEGESATGALLFMERAREAFPGFTPKTMRDVVALVAQLDGLPLAIELAAARVRVMSPNMISQRLTERFRLLRSSGVGRTTARQATLKATLDWSWALLTEEERAVLVQCAVFAGSFSLEAAEAILDLSGFDDPPWTVDLLETLMDKSLLRRLDGDTETTRFALYLSVRDYAYGQLHQGGVKAVTEASLTERYLTFFASYGDLHHVHRQLLSANAMQEVGQELRNLNAALDIALEQGRFEQAALCALALVPWFQNHGPRRTGLERLNAALALDTTQNPTPLRTRLLYRCGQFAHYLCTPEQGLEWLEEAIAGAQVNAMAAIEAHSMITMAYLYRSLGSYDDGVTLLTQALERAPNDPWIRALALDGLGILATAQGRLEDAVTHHRESKQVMESASLPPSPLATVHHNLAHNLKALGHLAEA
ncbi:MAG: hypothetical protein AAFS10_20625, partial [Myxococcota bacterium]